MATWTRNKRPLKVSKTEWAILAGLLFLCLIPSIAGSFRLTELSAGAEIRPDNARFFASPIPVAIHIVGSILYSVIGAFQFIKGIRIWKPRFHRTLGQYLVFPAGLAVALSGLWMTQFYDLPEIDGDILYVERWIFGGLMTLFLIFGYFAARQGKFKQHGFWMMRAYAIGIGAGSQAFTIMFGILIFGTYDEFYRALYMGAGWVINMLVAEYIIYQQKSAKKRKSTVKFSH